MNPNTTLFVSTKDGQSTYCKKHKPKSGKFSSFFAKDLNRPECDLCVKKTFVVEVRSFSDLNEKDAETLRQFIELFLINSPLHINRLWHSITMKEA